MKHFFLKTLILSIALFVSVIYGMETAKQNMMNMVGQTSKPTLNVVSQLSKPLPTPSLTGTGTSSSHGVGNQTSSSSAVNQSTGASQSSDTSAQQSASGSSNSTDDLTQRIQKLQTIQDFNPYSSLGESLSSGLQVTFTQGMNATSTLFDQLIKHVF